jgi:hypothetical protein
MNAQPKFLVLAAVAWALLLASPNADAQGFTRSLDIGPHIAPRIVTPPPPPAPVRIDPNVGGRASDVGGTTRFSTTNCTAAYRDPATGDCLSQPVGNRSSNGNGGSSSKGKKTNAFRNNGVAAAVATTAANNELLAELDGALTDRPGQRAGETPPAQAHQFAKLSPDQCDHWTVPHHRSALGGDREPRAGL